MMQSESLIFIMVVWSKNCYTCKCANSSQFKQGSPPNRSQWIRKKLRAGDCERALFHKLLDPNLWLWQWDSDRTNIVVLLSSDLINMSGSFTINLNACMEIDTQKRPGSSTEHQLPNPLLEAFLQWSEQLGPVLEKFPSLLKVGKRKLNIFWKATKIQQTMMDIYIHQTQKSKLEYTI